jgi:S1-C subfamily serine protease
MAKRVLLEDSPIWLGVDFVPLKGKLAKALNIPTFQGLLVQNVAKNSLGDALNLRAGSIPVKIQGIEFLLGGDIIIEIGGEDFYLTRKGLQRAKDYMQSVASGEMLQLSVMRDGKKVILEAEKP